jgi:dihydroflavonol-4-reductase
MISILPGKGSMVWKVNVEGTRNILAAIRQAGVRRLVYTSSIHALRRIEGNYVMDESVSFDPDNSAGIYDRSKATASLEVLAATKQGLDAVIVCPTGVVGPFDFRLSEMGSLILGWMGRGVHFLIDGSFDFVDVRDVARGHILAAEKGRSGETYILSGEQISLVRMHAVVRQVLGNKSPAVRIPLPLARFAALFTPLYYRLSHKTPQFTTYSITTVTGNSRFSHAKSSRELGYQPRPLADALVDTVKWWMRHQHLAYATRRIKPH